jgi:hypothetical protein
MVAIANDIYQTQVNFINFYLINLSVKRYKFQL